MSAKKQIQKTDGLEVLPPHQPEQVDKTAELLQNKKKERVELASQTERMKLRVDSLSEQMKPEEFVKQIPQVTNKLRSNLDSILINLRAEKNAINPDKWGIASDPELAAVMQDWQTLGLPLSTPFYQELFYVLKTSKENTKLKPEQKLLYNAPEENLLKIKDFDLTFYEAYTFYLSVKAQMQAYNLEEVKALEEQKGNSVEDIAGTAIDGAKSVVGGFLDDVHDGNWGSALVKALGAFALYKGYSAIAGSETGGGVMSFLKNTLFVGAGAYALHSLAKHAGFDVFKASGLSRSDQELDETVFAGVTGLHMKSLEKYNPGYLLKMSEVNIGDLYDQFKESDSHGYHFIRPDQFPGIFPDLRGYGTRFLGMSDTEYDSYVGNSGNRLTFKEKEYIEAGRQLYQTVLVMREAYEKTLQTREGVTFDQLMTDKKYAEYRDAKIRHFASLIHLYSPSAKKELMAPLLDKVRGDFTARFNMAFATNEMLQKAGYNIERAVNDGVYLAHFKGYPVYLHKDSVSGGYKAYLADKYNGDEMPGTEFAAELRLDDQGNMNNELGKLLDAIDKRMAVLTKNVGVADEVRGVEFKDGHWVATAKLAALPAFGIKEQELTLIVEVKDDGSRVEVVDRRDPSVKFDLDEKIARQHPYEFIVKNALMADKKFAALAPISKKISLDIPQGSKGEFKMKVEGMADVDLKYDNGTHAFEFANAADEAAFVQSEEFAAKYVEALGEDKDLEVNKTLTLIETEIRAAKEGFLGHFWMSVISRSPLDYDRAWLRDATHGAIGNEVASALVESVKYEAFAKIQGRFAAASTLEDVRKSKDAVLLDLVPKLHRVADALTKHRAMGWERKDFEMQVLDVLSSANAESHEFAERKANFQSQLFDKLAGSGDIKANKMARLMNAYVYYASEVDVKGLDSLVYPPDKANTDASFYRLAYIHYVEGTILSTMTVPTALDNFATWKQKNPDSYAEGIDVNDAKMGPLNGADHVLGVRNIDSKGDLISTKLDSLVASRVVYLINDFLKIKFADQIDETAISDYLYLDRSTAKKNGRKLEELGMLYFYVDSKGAPHSKLWDFVDKEIPKNILQMNKLSDQIAVIDRVIDEKLVSEILSHPEKYFKKPETIKEMLAKSAPGVLQVPVLGWALDKIL